MSKTNKLTLLILALVCVISICFNVIQCNGKSASDSTAAELEALRSQLRNDSLTHVQDSLRLDSLQKMNRELIGKINKANKALK